ncbi:Rha family transcriptional regulator [Salmonella enterica]|nr:Rha family transcriptional regulator [Salmonella enterica]EJG5923178.1 Rha family transcriptional regulator [Salmonella enterica]ELX2843920.1 Rha family transcriptional regulator [Salmonella enterica]
MKNINNSRLSITSREIAELAEKRHDNVKRIIEKHADQGVIVRPQIEDEQSTDAFGIKRI